MNIVPASPKNLIQFVEAIPYQIAGVLIYPSYHIGKMSERCRHEKCMCKFGISKSIIVLTDQSVQIGRATAGICYDKDRFFDLYLSVFKKENLIDQTKEEMNELIEKKLKDEKYRKNPHTQIEFSV